MANETKIKISSNRNFGLIFSLFFLIIALWNFRGNFQEVRILPFCFSIIFFTLGLLNSKYLTPLNKIWFKFGFLLGNIVAPIIMGFVFFLVITPTSFIMKIIGKDLLKKKFNKNKKTYWLKYEKSSETMKRQF